jgi:hypothetical protein
MSIINRQRHHALSRRQHLGRPARWGWSLLLGSALAGLSGCSSGGMVEIHGQVTFDGAVLEDGAIRFEPLSGGGPSAGAVVQHGAYRVRLAAGEKTLRIERFKTVGQRPFNPSDPNSAMIPTKEVRMSTSTCNVPATGGPLDLNVVGQD